MMTFIQENLATLLGAFIPVLGSVFLIHYDNYEQEKRRYKLYFRRACELIKYNMEIAHSRIMNNMNTIPFTNEELSFVLNDMESTSINRSKDTYNDLFELIFTIRTGEKLNMSFKNFYEIVFIQTRKANADFSELARIIDSVGVNQVYEFKILRQLILLSRKMGIKTSFDEYYQLVKSINKECDKETCIRYYIAELIEHYHNGLSNRIYYVDYALKKDLILESVSYSINDIKQDDVELIRNQLNLYQNILLEYSKKDIWLKYLENITIDSITVKAPYINEVNQFLDNLYLANHHIYLSFLGICANGDALDNNERSRQKEYMEHVRDNPYILQHRGWYQEALLDPKDDVSISLPYIDTSKSYVISFVKKLYIDDEIVGVLGIDVIVDDLLHDIIDKQQMIMFTIDGEIIFDSTNHYRDQKLFFNNIFLEEGVQLTSLMKNNQNGYIKNHFYFATLVKNRYYCIIY